MLYNEDLYKAPTVTKAKSQPYEPWRKLLLDAADLIEKHGHCKHKLEDSQGAHCIVGALMIVGGDGYSEAATRLDRMCNGRMGSFIDFNNAPETTARDVIDLMRRAAST